MSGESKRSDKSSKRKHKKHDRAHQEDSDFGAKPRQHTVLLAKESFRDEQTKLAEEPSRQETVAAKFHEEEELHGEPENQEAQDSVAPELQYVNSRSCKFFRCCRWH